MIVVFMLMVVLSGNNLQVAAVPYESTELCKQHLPVIKEAFEKRKLEVLDLRCHEAEKVTK